MTATIDAPPMLNKWDILDGIGWDPHAGQLECSECTKRFRVVSAGRRFGKSDIGGHELVPEALYTATMADDLIDAGKRREFWIVGPEYSDSEKEFRVIWNELTKLEVPFDRPGSYNNPESGDLHISAWRGAFQVHGKSAKYPDSLVGEGLSGAILAEAAKLKQRIWPKFIRPTLSDFNGWALFTSTPEGKNWFYDMWTLGQDPRNREWWSTRQPSWRNPYVYTETGRKIANGSLPKGTGIPLKEWTSDKHVKMCQTMGTMKQFRGMNEFDIAEQMNLRIDSEILSLMVSTTQASFNQEIGAGFEDYVGKVFKEFDEEIHVKPLEFNPAWETYAAVDYGYNNPNVWLLLQVGPWSEVHVLDELYLYEYDPMEFADEVILREMCPTSLIAFYPDPSLPGNTRILQNRLHKRARTNTGGELEPRLNAIRKALKESPLHVPRGHEDRRPQLWIDPRCKKFIFEMNEYKYPEKKDKNNSTKAHDAPMKDNDHGPEALGRFFKGYFGVPEDIPGGRRSVKANMGRGTKTKKQYSPPAGIPAHMVARQSL